MSQANAKVWAHDLEGISFEDAVEALRAHYQESTSWVMPADIIRRVDPWRHEEWGWANRG